MDTNDLFDKLFPPSALDGVLPDSKPKAGQAPSPDANREGNGLREEVWTVSRLILHINTMLDDGFGRISVEGEVSGAKKATSGHMYFTLRDEGGALAAVMFRGRSIHGMEYLEEGARVVCTGILNVYRDRGQLQMVVDKVTPSGEGELRAAFLRLKARLEAEGLFDQGRKRPIPPFPKTIFLITSPRGAAIADFLKASQDRFTDSRIILCPSQVQGDQAPEQLIAALKQALSMAEDGDVVVFMRGGGSLQDLWAFNDETLARAIAASPVPVVSAVGHEIDVTICDLVADLRVPTPTAAALALFSSKAELSVRLAELEARLQGATLGILDRKRRKVEGLKSRIRHPSRLLAENRLRLDDLVTAQERSITRILLAKRSRLQGLRLRVAHASPILSLQRLRQEVAELRHRANLSISRLLHDRQGQLASLASRLDGASPLSCLQKGFCLVSIPLEADGSPPAFSHLNGKIDTEKRLLRDADEVSVGDILEIVPSRGRLLCKVTGKDPSFDLLSQFRQNDEAPSGTPDKEIP